MLIFIPIDTAGSSVSVDTNFTLLSLFFRFANSASVSISERTVDSVCRSDPQIIVTIDVTYCLSAVRRY
jgi:hypothetical protein